MKTKCLMLSILFACTSMIVLAQSKTDTIKVWGNCETCKGKIEKAAIAAGASAAEWNDETKLLVVSYDASKTSNLDIQGKIASAGYDTQDAKATEAAYKKLEKCCQYKRPAQDTSSMKDMHGMQQMRTDCMAMMSRTKNMNCSKDDCRNAECYGGSRCKDASSCSSCNDANDCCKTKFGKGYNYIGSSCTTKKTTGSTVVLSTATANCCKS
jgi:mercuric ion binding protein